MLQEKKDARIYFPMYVLWQENTNDFKFGVDETEWEKLRNLSKEKQAIITDPQIQQHIQVMEQQYRLDSALVARISFFIRKIFFDEMTLVECEKNFEKLLGITEENIFRAKAIVDYIEKKILTIQPKLPVDEKAGGTEMLSVLTVSIPLFSALAQYEMLGQQTITMEKIKLKTQRTPVRPSLVNWIKYYRDELGVGHHDSVQRGNFLFRSENGKKLSSEDREHVNLVLKSIEENFPLTIDTARQEIVFPPFEESFSVSAKSFPPLKKEGREEKDAHFTFSPVRRAGEETAIPLPLKKAFSPHTEGDIVMQRGTAFPVVPRKDAVSPVTPPAVSSSLGGGISFSTKHILPAEKEMTEKAISPTPKKTVPFSGNGPFRITTLSSERQGSFEEGDL